MKFLDGKVRGEMLQIECAKRDAGQVADKAIERAPLVV
jgi:hypothetical protein